MGKGNAVWGIDLGQCALKAIRCHVREDGETIVADAFDYIEYPKLLSQPEAEPETLIHDALSQFLSRNSVKGDKVAISVSGQSGLARFIKLPPVEAKKIPDIVKYEARQQIPFSLDEVIWDYQPLAGGTEEEGFALETSVGLFAMKRDQVYKAIKPFDRAGIDLDIIQLSPLAVYNTAIHEILKGVPPASQIDWDNPPPSTVVVSLGTETTDLVITDGYHVWQRSIPVGGNHFTKALSKELKLTFAKAEHLKRNAKMAEDPRVVFQAMRPVFNDLVTQIQRSIGYFSSIDRKAKMGRIMAMGNAVKLPGLQPYLAKNLGMEVELLEEFPNLAGPAVTAAPAFKENLSSFGVAYGLAIQGLDQGRLSTNLLPREILTGRLIESKRPWAVAAAGALLLGCCFNFLFLFNAWTSVDLKAAEYSDPASGALTATRRVQDTSRTYTDQDNELQTEAARLKALGDEVVGTADGRLLWLELLRAVNASLPVEEGIDPEQISPKPIEERANLYIKHVEAEYFPDLAAWYTDAVQKKYMEGKGGSAPETTAPAAPVDQFGGDEYDDGFGGDGGFDDGTGGGSGGGVQGGPSGPGWVIELYGYHFHNKDRATEGAQYVRKTLLKNLEEGSVELPVQEGVPPNNTTRMVKFTMKELGISYPLLAQEAPIDRRFKIANPDFEGAEPGAGGDAGGFVPFGGDAGGGAAPVNPDNPQFFEVPKYTFTVQFCWQEKRASERMEARRQQELEAQRQAEEAAAGAGDFEGGEG